MCDAGKSLTDAAPPTCVTSLTGCLIVANGAPTTNCATPAEGYYLNSGVATAITLASGNCKTSTDNTTCTACKTGFHLVDGTTCTAFTGNPNCTTGNSVTVCTACAAGFYLKSATECVANPTGCTTAKWFTDVAHCSQCDVTASYFATDITSGITA